MSDLHVPDHALNRLAVCDAERHLHDRADTCVRAIAAPVVAAELRRLADEINPTRENAQGSQRYRDGWFDGASHVYDSIVERADQLDADR